MKLNSASRRLEFPAVCLTISKTKPCELETEAQNVVAERSTVRVPGHTRSLSSCQRSCDHVASSFAGFAVVATVVDLPQNSALVNSGIFCFQTHFCYFALM